MSQFALEFWSGKVVLFWEYTLPLRGYLAHIYGNNFDYCNLHLVSRDQGGAIILQYMRELHNKEAFDLNGQYCHG